MEDIPAIPIPLTSKMSKEEYAQMELFKARCRILWDNWESLKKQGLKLGGSFCMTNHDKRTFTGQSCSVDSFRLKGFYVDFRFFYAKKEVTHIFKIMNVLAKHCEDKRLLRELSYNRKGWNNAFVFQSLLGLSADQMFAYWFNGDVFHSIEKYRKGVVEVLEIMNSDLAHHVLMLGLRDRMVTVGNLFWMLEPLSYKRQEVRIHSLDHPIGQLIHGKTAES